jgi:hypothetical protein
MTLRTRLDLLDVTTKQVSYNQGTVRSSSLLVVWFLILNPVQCIAGYPVFLKSLLIQPFSEIICTEFVS